MAQENENENQLTESSSNNNTISELPGRPFGITMEFPLFVTMLAVSLSGTAISNIILYRTCVHSLNHTVEECRFFLAPERTNETTKLEEEVQKYATFVQTVKIVIESIGPAILSMFLGVWSDTHGRKPLVVWPLLGVAMSSILVVIYSMMEHLGPWWFVLTAIPFGLTGGFSVIFTGAFCYISDITTTKTRSLRMTILEAAVSAGSVIGSLLSAHLLKAIGNVYLLLLVASLYVIAYAFTNVHLRESLNGALPGGICSVLDILLVKEMFRECFKRRPNNLRTQLLLVTVANSLSVFMLYGLFGLSYMYTREKLHWALKDYTQYSAITTTISFTGSFFGVAVLQKYLSIGDLAFSIVAFLSTAAEYTVKAFAAKTWHMYLGSAISLFGGLSSPLLRSFISKIMPVEDIAKVFALMCAIEGISPLISPPLYNTLYEYTITAFPGAIMLLTSVISTICAVLLCFTVYYRWYANEPTYEPLQIN
ncbi:hypothetical protein ABMA28_006421 [Loxostege sticticalis]|uniref:Major facilitator superfamily (MFS) profile domain-containing protein n=1 Tax=Loxostege sticticalis TaxID=481309 RepID=A0ABD0SQ53_LOXSC